VTAPVISVSLKRTGRSAAFSEHPQSRLGEHSLEVLREAGLTESKIKALGASSATVNGKPKAQAAE